jgi:hypothetical protein
MKNVPTSNILELFDGLKREYGLSMELLQTNATAAVTP